MTIAIMILMVGVTERVIARLGFRITLSAGLAVLAIGIGGLALIDSNGSFAVDVLAASLIAAVGMSLAYIPAMVAALSGAKPEEQGLASGIFNTSYQVGSAFGLAVMTAIAAAQGADRLDDLAALTDGFQAAFIGAAGIAAAGSLLAFSLLRSPQADAVEEQGRQEGGDSERERELAAA